MKFAKCIKCGKSQIDHQQIFLTDDGYCTVCNHKYKDRSRIKPYFEFKTIKEGNYDHMNKWGQKRTEANIYHNEIAPKLKGFNASVRGLYHKQYKESKKRHLDEWI